MSLLWKVRKLFFKTFIYLNSIKQGLKKKWKSISISFCNRSVGMFGLIYFKPRCVDLRAFLPPGSNLVLAKNVK